MWMNGALLMVMRFMDQGPLQMSACTVSVDTSLHASQGFLRREMQPHPHSAHPHAVAVDHDIWIYKCVAGALTIACTQANPVNLENSFAHIPAMTRERLA